MLVVIMGMLIFSGLAYVSEKDEKETKFISMPQVGVFITSFILLLCYWCSFTPFPLFTFFSLSGTLLGHNHNDVGWLRRYFADYMVRQAGWIR